MAGNREDDVVVWLRLPRSMSLKELTELGLDGAACFGGDTSIAATSTGSGGAGLVVKAADLKALLEKAGIPAKADCYGGDTCIVCGAYQRF